jgi:hypothetical protein
LMIYKKFIKQFSNFLNLVNLNYPKNNYC